MNLQFYKLNDDQENENNNSIKSGYTFLVGIGFLPDDPVQREIKNLRRHSILISVSLIFIMIITSVTRNHYDSLFRFSGFFSSSVFTSIAHMLVVAIAFGIVILFYTNVMNKKVRLKRQTNQSIRVSFVDILFYVLIFLGAVCLSKIVTYAFTHLLEFFHIFPKSHITVLPKTVLEIILYIFSWCIVPCIFEELFFRGVLLTALRKFGNIFALLISSILYALYRGNIAAFPEFFLISFVMGFLAIETNSLLFPGIMRIVTGVISKLFELPGFKEINLNKIVSYTFIFVLIGISIISLYLLGQRQSFCTTTPAKNCSALNMKSKQLIFFTSNSMLLLFIVALMQFITSVELIF